MKDELTTLAMIRFRAALELIQALDPGKATIEQAINIADEALKQVEEVMVPPPFRITSIKRAEAPRGRPHPGDAHAEDCPFFGIPIHEECACGLPNTTRH